jgi:hypothetical protein
MAYLIYKSNGSAISVPDNLINTAYYNATGGGGYGPGNVPQAGHGLGTQLVGRNRIDYGAAIAQNLVQLQENFSSATTPSDVTSLQGQMWFKQNSTTSGDLFVRTTANTSGGILNWQRIITENNAGDSDVGTVTTGVWQGTPIGILYGGTGQTTATGAINALLPSQTSNAGKALLTDGTNISWTSITNGTVTSIAVSGGSTGLTTSGGPVTTSGTITVAGTLNITSGGTGQTTATGAINALLPSQTSNAGKVLQTNGTNTSWSTTGSLYSQTVTFPGTTFAINDTFVLPSNTIGINVLFSTSSASNNGAWGRVEMYTVGNVLIGKTSVFAANNPAGGDGGSGMNWRGANYIAIPTNASYVKFIRESGGNSGTFVLEQIVRIL